MANSFYDPGASRAEKVNDLFQRIAPRYDLINDLQSFGLHRHWKRRLVDLAGPGAAKRALDFCCGTGDIAFELASRGCDVIGLDFSEAMLTVARERKARLEKNPQNPAGNVAFVQGDAMATGMPSESFDVVTVGYGLRNLSDWKAGIAEMVRVLKPGGRVLVLDFGKPDNLVWRSLYFAYLRLCVPLFGLVFCRNAAAYSYILESLKHYPAQNGVAAEMTACRLKNVQIIRFLGGVMTVNYGEKADVGPGASIV
jgi:demethylmenaquinone methyltransferase/2-methoxy-6-polyprenyl-1,4-benzoquinol methylase